MYEVFKDLLKLADDMFDVTECHLWKNGGIDIVGTDGGGDTVVIRFAKEDNGDS